LTELGKQLFGDVLFSLLSLSCLFFGSIVILFYARLLH